MSRRPGASTASLITPREVRRLAKRKHISEVEAHARLIEKRGTPAHLSRGTVRLVVLRDDSTGVTL